MKESLVDIDEVIEDLKEGREEKVKHLEKTAEKLINNLA